MSKFTFFGLYGIFTKYFLFLSSIIRDMFNITPGTICPRQSHPLLSMLYILLWKTFLKDLAVSAQKCCLCSGLFYTGNVCYYITFSSGSGFLFRISNPSATLFWRTVFLPHGVFTSFTPSSLVWGVTFWLGILCQLRVKSVKNEHLKSHLSFNFKASYITIYIRNSLM